MAGRPKEKDPSECKTAQTTLLLKPSTKEALKEYAWEHRTSMNDLANRIFESYLSTIKE